MDAKEERLGGGFFFNSLGSIHIESLEQLEYFYSPLASAFSDSCVSWWGSSMGAD